MIDRSTPKGRVTAAAFELAAERPWRDVTYHDIAERAETDLAALRREFPSKTAMLAAFGRMVDDEVLAKAKKPAANLSPRDALFEVVMSRFDAMAPYKAALRSIMETGAGDVSLARRLMASQAWMLRAAGIDTEGVEGFAKVAGLAGVYASAFRTWLTDDDPGMAKTMSALDRGLRRGERAFETVRSVTSLFAKRVRPATTKMDTSPAPDAAPNGSAPSSML